MRTLIEDRITELTEERAKILKRLADQFKDTHLTSDIISRAASTCNEIDIRISEAERLLRQSKHFYGSKTPNIKQDGSEQQES
jgi:hypothetical protein